MFMMVPYLALSQDINFKQIIKKSVEGQVCEIRDTVSNRTSTLIYLGYMRVGDTTLYLINHVFDFPIAPGSIRKNQRMWVLTENESLGYYMIVEMDNELLLAVVENKYLVFKGSNVDFTERFRKCLQLDRTFCFTDWKFELSNRASNNWIKWPQK